jgi:hypothetical protein
MRLQLSKRSRITTVLERIENIRDHILASLKLGKQAPDYKRSKALLDKFIASLDQKL